MIIPVIYPSASEFWLNSSNLVFTNQLSLDKRTLLTLPHDFGFCSDLRIIDNISKRYGLSQPVKLMVPDAIRRRKNQIYTSCTSPSSMNNSGFLLVSRISASHSLRLPEDVFVYIASPELCFLQAALDMSLFQLIQFGYSLCAEYITDKNAVFGQRSREQIASANSITEFISHSLSRNGIHRAAHASRYILDSSNSPMETITAIISILPFSEGGFALRKPVLNKPVKLSPQGAELLGRSECRGDLVWEAEKVIVEYDSALTHLSRKQHTIDKNRATALSLSGYTVIVITPDTLLNYEEASKTFISIRKALGMRPFDHRVKNHRDLFYRLCSEIYPKPFIQYTPNTIYPVEWKPFI